LLLREVEDKDKIQAGYVYLTPADYYLLVEPGNFALDIDRSPRRGACQFNYALPETLGRGVHPKGDFYGPSLRQPLVRPYIIWERTQGRVKVDAYYL
jgi:hypothetical protein